MGGCFPASGVLGHDTGAGTIPAPYSDMTPISAGIARIVRRVRSAREYAGTGDWLLSLYDRLLNSRPGRILPGRGYVKRLRLRGHERSFHVRLGTSDISVALEIFVRKEYDTVRTMLQEPKAIVDLGANIGLSIRLWRELFPRARVIAVEPDPVNLGLCRRNNPGDDAVTLVQACVAARAGRVHLDRSGPPWSYRMTTAGLADTESLSMTDLLRRHLPDGPVDLLKCDIEGAECEVFSECAPWIDRVRHLVVEVHTPYSVSAFRSDIGEAFLIHSVLDFGLNALIFASRKASHGPGSGASGVGS